MKKIISIIALISVTAFTSCREDIEDGISNPFLGKWQTTFESVEDVYEYVYGTGYTGKIYKGKELVRLDCYLTFFPDGTNCAEFGSYETKSKVIPGKYRYIGKYLCLEMTDDNGIKRFSYEYSIYGYILKLTSETETIIFNKIY